ncbi:MAG: hypothetical protein U0441_09980 [Polyangiaceae bacterium]
MTSPSMDKVLPRLTPIASVMRNLSAYGRGALAGVNRTLAPLPVPGLEGVRYAILFTTTEPIVGSAALRIKTPSHVAYADAESGEFLELAAITPRDLGVAQDPDHWLGEFVEPMNLDEKRMRYLDRLDAVSFAFAAGRGAETPDVRRAAGELTAAFADIQEAPLAPYYRALAGRFFAWLARASA